MNEIRQEIIRKLMHKPGLHFNNLWNENIESNKFAYHLKTLRKKNLIKKDGEEYYLTEKGKEYVSSVDGKSGKKSKNPLSCVAIVLKKDSQTLMLQREKEPFYGYWGFPSGKIEFDQYILEAAASELKEETGLEADLTLRGLLCSKTYSEGKISYNHQIFVVKGENPKGELRKKTREGKNFWIDTDDVEGLESFPDVPNLLKVASNKGFDVLQVDRFQEDGKFKDMGKIKEIEF